MAAIARWTFLHALRFSRGGGVDKFVLLSVLYFLASAFGIGLMRIPGAVATVWLANAIAIAFLLRSNRRDWPVLLVGIGLSGFAAGVVLGHPAVVSAGLMLANLVEIGIAIALARAWIGRQIRLTDGVWTYLRLLTVMAVVAPPIAGLPGAYMAAWAFGAPIEGAWISWVEGSAVGAIIVMPVAMLLKPASLRAIRGNQPPLALAALFPGGFFAGILAMYLPGTPLILIGIPIIVAGLWFHPLTAALVAATAVGAAIGVHLIAHAGEHALDVIALIAALSVVAPFAVSLMVHSLREDRARFRLAMDGSTVGMALIDLDGRWMRANRAMLDFLGYEEDELSTISWERVTHPDDLETTETLRSKLTQGEISVLRKRNRYVRKDGEVVWGDVAVSILRDDVTKEPIYRIVQIVDMTARMKAQMALAESEQRWSFALESARQGVWDYNIKTGKTYYSNVWKAMLGYRPHEIGDDSIAWKSFVHPDDLSRVERLDKEHLKGRSRSFEQEFRMRHKDGHWVWVLDRGKVIERDAAGEPLRMIGTHTDITERKRGEDKMRRLSQRVHLATKAGGVGLWEYHLDSGELWWDERMRSLYDLGPEDEVNYDVWANTLHPDDRETAEHDVEAAATGERPYDTEFRVVLADGSVRHIRSLADTMRDEDGKPIVLVGTNWDVSETHALTAELAAGKERLRVTLESIGDGVICTGTDLRVTFMNRVAENETGWSFAEAEGRALDEVFTLADEWTEAPVGSPVSACLETRRPAESQDEIVLVNRQGGRKDVRSTAAPIIGDDDDLLGAVLVFQDVTRARRMQRQLAYSASHDSLTDLKNRASFERTLKSLVDDAVAEGHRHALCFIDLDEFKAVNDRAGHTAGDQVLRMIARTVRAGVRSVDVAARLGGDEFALLLLDCTLEDAERICNKLRNAIAELEFTFAGRTFQVGVSAGIAPIDGTEPASDVLRAADQACYEAKAAGRNRVRIARQTETGEFAAAG